MHILIVEDKENLRQMLTAAVERMGFAVDTAEDGRQAQLKIKQRRYALILTDLRLPKGSGLEVLSYSRELDDSIPVIVMTAYGTIEEAVSAMKNGAFDFIQKPLDLDHLRLLIERALEQERIVRENILLREAVQQAYGFPDIISEDESIMSIEREIQKVAPTEATVLIQGSLEPARSYLPEQSTNSALEQKHPFVAVNCAAIPETLIENELFGHEKGAYTGADSRRMGKFELAHRGTLFLDEIGELPLQVQAKTLRVLETKIFERIGSVQTQEADVRIVVATNRDLQEAVQQKHFREDLFFRLSVVPVTIPPLRERQGDLRLLALHFLKKFGREFKKENLVLSESAFKLVESYRWPGNVRELQNCLERAVIMCDGSEILPEDLNLAFHQTQTTAEVPEGFDLTGSLSEASLRAMVMVEKAKISQALRLAKWNKTKTAETLNVGYKTLLSKIKEYGLEEE